MGRKIDLTGQRFGRLTVVEEVGRSTDGKVLWKCVCDCGNETVVTSNHLRSGHTTSCGCFRKEVITDVNTKHGHNTRAAVSPEYRTWQAMIARCEYISQPGYKYYGAKGVKVCDRWRNSFEAFLEDMGPKPGREYSIDRINPFGNYEPKNCRWATRDVQARNKRLRKLTAEQVDEIRAKLARGVMGAAIAREFGVSNATVSRIKHGETHRRKAASQ